MSRIGRLLCGVGLVMSASFLMEHSVIADPPSEAPPKKSLAPRTPEPKPAHPAPKQDEAGHDDKQPTEIVQDRKSKKPSAKPAEDEHDQTPSAPPDGAPAANDDDAHAKKKPLAEQDDAVAANEAMKRLKEGNLRWVNEQMSDPNVGTERRQLTAEKGQKPFATILTCADSRIPVERVFDRGVAELFVIRVAGNVVGPDASGSIEYGAEHLHVPLLVVMGHTKCGAVNAAIGGGDAGGNISQLVTKISPAVDRTRQQHPDLDAKEMLTAAVRENVWQSIFDLVRTSSTVRELLTEKKLQVVGAVYDVATGKVEWIGEHPWQDALVQAFETREKKPGPAAATANEKEH